MTKWLPPTGYTGKVHQMDVKLGGGWRMTFFNFTSGSEMSFGGKYPELVPNERISYTSAFDDKNLPGDMKTTITLAKVSAGVEINIVQEGIPAVIPVDQCYVGWQQSLMLLAQLVEPEINQ